MQLLIHSVEGQVAVGPERRCDHIATLGQRPAYEGQTLSIHCAVGIAFQLRLIGRTAGVGIGADLLTIGGSKNIAADGAQHGSRAVTIIENRFMRRLFCHNSGGGVNRLGLVGAAGGKAEVPSLNS